MLTKKCWGVILSFLLCGSGENLSWHGSQVWRVAAPLTWRHNPGKVHKGRGFLPVTRQLENTLSNMQLKLLPGFPYLPPECQLPSWLLGLFSPVQTPHLYPMVSTQQNTFQLCAPKALLPQPTCPGTAYTHTLGLAAAVELVFSFFYFRTAIISSLLTGAKLKKGLCFSWSVDS